MTVGATVSTEAPAAYLARYGLMLLIRLFETEMQRLFLKGEVHGTTHLCAGQEAVPVGVCSALEPEDYLAGTYRGHGHALAKGTEPDALLAEMLGRATGVCGGRAGSMNVIDVEHGLVGCFGIVGGSIAAATGAALSAKREGRVAVATFGDGATNHDGNDLWAVRDAAVEAVARARSGEGPTLLECQTYRHHGHSKADPAKYRPPEEVERWLSRDPLNVARERLRQLGVSDDEVAGVEEATKLRIDRAVQSALGAPYPDPMAEHATEFAP